MYNIAKILSVSITLFFLSQNCFSSFQLGVELNHKCISDSNKQVEITIRSGRLKLVKINQHDYTSQSTLLEPMRDGFDYALTVTNYRNGKDLNMYLNHKSMTFIYQIGSMTAGHLICGEDIDNKSVAGNL